MPSEDKIELLTVTEFAQRFRIGRTTVFKWKRDGILEEGKHFVKIGRIVRYIWSHDAISEIHHNSMKYENNLKKKPKRKINEKSRINWNY